MQKRLATLALAMVLTPALAMAQKTSYDFDKAANFTGFKTYALKDGTKVGQPLIDDRIVERSTRSLRPRASRRAKRTRMCLSSTTWHSTSRRTSRRSAPDTVAATAGTVGDTVAVGRAAASSTTTVRDILVGTLVIDMADAKKGQMTWRGMGVKEVDTGANPEKRDKSINNAVKKISRITRRR